VVLAGALAFLFSPKLTASPVWRATVTPLASIIGSGFLVSFPLLTHDLGSYSVIAMTSLVGFAYLLGGAIRFNILHGEPLFLHGKPHFAKGGRGWLGTVESASHPALALAYFISVIPTTSRCSRPSCSKVWGSKTRWPASLSPRPFCSASACKVCCAACTASKISRNMPLG
jgi:hypothetical protein